MADVEVAHCWCTKSIRFAFTINCPIRTDGQFFFSVAPTHRVCLHFAVSYTFCIAALPIMNSVRMHCHTKWLSASRSAVWTTHAYTVHDKLTFYELNSIKMKNEVLLDCSPIRFTLRFTQKLEDMFSFCRSCKRQLRLFSQHQSIGIEALQSSRHASHLIFFSVFIDFSLSPPPLSFRFFFNFSFRFDDDDGRSTSGKDSDLNLWLRLRTALKTIKYDTEFAYKRKQSDAQIVCDSYFIIIIFMLINYVIAWP